MPAEILKVIKKYCVQYKGDKNKQGKAMATCAQISKIMPRRAESDFYLEFKQTTKTLRIPPPTPRQF